MTRLYHSSLRHILCQLLLLAATAVVSAQSLEHTPQQIFYSTDETAAIQHEYWYVIRFCQNKDLALTYDDTSLKVGSYASGSAAADAPDEFKWKLISSGTAGWYYMVSKAGRYVKFTGSPFSTDADKANAVKVHLVYNRNNPHRYAWQIQREGSGNSMNPDGGLSAGKAIAEWNTGTENNAFLFDLVEESDFDCFLQFSAYGRWAMYDDGIAQAPMLQSPSADTKHPAEPGYMWIKTKHGDGYILRSGNGRYIALGEDGNSMVMTGDETAAATITASLNPFACDVNGTGGRSVDRYMYTIGGKVIAIDEDGGSIVLADTPAEPSRATVIREAFDIDGAEPPIMSEGEASTWYKIKFTATGDYLAVGDDADKLPHVGASTAPFEPSMTWRLEKAGQDLFRLAGYNGEYLMWQDADACFAAGTDKTAAALFRLAEYAETGSDRDKWVLHYVGATTANQYMLPNDAKDKVGLTPSITLGKAPVIFESVDLSQEIEHLPQPIYYSTADGIAPQLEYWYVIRFCHNKNVAITYDANVLKLGSYPSSNAADDASDEMLWKFIPSEKEGWYYMVCKTGMYVKFVNGRFRPDANKCNATKVHLIYNSANAYPYAWQIQREGSGSSMNPHNGPNAGNEMAEYGTGDVNNALMFELVERGDRARFLQFSSYGRWALYDGGAGTSLISRKPADGVAYPADPGYKWTKKTRLTGGYTLRSGNGNYIALAPDGNSLVMTSNEAEAAAVRTSVHPYVEEVNGTGTRLLTRYAYTINGKAISMDWFNGHVALTSVSSAPRATIIREAFEIDGAEPPVVSSGSTLQTWYNINFVNAGGNLAVGDDASRLAFVRKGAHVFEPLMAWCLEDTGTGEDLFYLKNHSGGYLQWNDADACFFAGDDKAHAAPFRLTECTETGADRDKWVLHYVGSKGSEPEKQYMQPGEGNDKVMLASATALGKAPVIFKKVEAADADFCTEGDNYWRRLYFFDTAMDFGQALRGDGDVVGVGTPDTTYKYLWKNIGDKDGFVLKNTAGQYLALNDAKDGFVYTTDRSEAAMFSLTGTDHGNDLLRSWLFVYDDNGTRKVMRKDDEGRIVLVDEEDAGTMPEDANFYLGEKLVFRLLAPVPGQYCTIGAGNLFLSDGFADVYDAVAANINTLLGGAKTVTNDFLWTFVERDGAYLLKNRNGNFMVWNLQGDNTFAVSTDESLATRFRMQFPGEQLAANGENAAPYLFPIGGMNITEENILQTLDIDADGNAVLSASPALLDIAVFPIYEAEDYTSHKIISKRSWFIKLAEGQKETSNSFIHSTEDGSYGLKQVTLADGTTIRRQNTNDYRIVRYMKRNTMRELRLPTSLYAGNPTETRLKEYQRWYNYDTDGLIPDSLVFLNQQSRRNYSNGTVMGRVMHLNGQSRGEHVGFGFNFKMPDNVPADFEYTVGLDMSFYTDFVEYYGDNGTSPYDPANYSNELYIPVNDNLVEPTLAGRCIYVVRNAHIMAKQLTALPAEQGKWMEEYNVAFPARKVNFKDCALPLDNEFANYWIYKDGVEAEENLIPLTHYTNLEFVVNDTTNTANITIDQYPIVKGATGVANADTDLSQLRFFRFKYPDGDYVADGSQADIEVYAKDGDRRYRLAVYHLTFVDGTELRSYNEIIGMKDDGTGNLVPKSSRSPRQLRKDIGEPTAHITFDFNEYETYQAPPKGKNYSTKSERDAGMILPNTYRYPLRYENTSYVFEPTYINGNATVDYNSGVEENAFGSYTIAKTTRFGWAPRARFYPVRKYYQDAYPQEDYDWSNCGFLYIDASECPGRIVSLDFDGNICKGTRITVSAWVSSPNCPDDTNGDPNAAYANVFFNILGYYTENGVEKEEKIYTYCPGPISGNALLSDGTKHKSEQDKDGVWQQIYFTFIPRAEHIIERFVLNVNNACTNSAGGDILIDDIEVYAATPTVKVANTLPVCHSSLTLTRIEADYETMMNALGLEEEDLALYKPAINYCVVDSALYQKELKRLTEAGDPMPANNAMRLAAVGDIRRVSINTNFNDLPTYDHAKAVEAAGPKVWKFVDDNGMKQIVISDKIVGKGMSPNKQYYLAAYFTYSSEPVDFSNFQVGTKCSISTVFTTRNSFNFIIDGDEDIADGADATVCAGTNVTLSAKFRGINQQTGEEVQRILPCDWWLGYYGGNYSRAYIKADGSYVLDAEQPDGAVSVSEALTNFRFFYPEATSTNSCSPASGVGYTLTQAMIDGLDQLTRPVTGEGARPALLMLHHRNINLQIPCDLGVDEEYIVTLQPINNLTDVDEEFENCIVCFEADTLSIRVNGMAPGLLNGFGDVAYPAHITNVPLRLTLGEVDKIRSRESGLRIPLRSINPVSEKATGLEPIKIVESESEEYMPVYISDTSDPDRMVFTDDGGLMEVGRVIGMSARKGDKEGYVDINFLDDFIPREGYIYTMRVNYRETLPDGIQPNTCDGSFVFDLKMVPRYVVWTPGADNTEWTNDLNWRRADRTDLKFDAQTEKDYITNDSNTTASAFVPLAGTSVIVAPHASYQPVLHDSTIHATEGILLFTGHESEVTPDIAYDLIMGTNVAETAPYTSLRFRTNRCDGLVLQSGAELVQAQHLDYKKAWTEYELERGRWYTLGTPLQQIYAGDWYAPKGDGREAAPYFHDIIFDTDLNDRFSPAVYQRGWDKGEARLYYLADPTVTDPGLHVVRDTSVAVRAEWSSVYNDVNVPYGHAGFSLKAEHGSSDKMLFRLPKEDTAYLYYMKNTTDTPVGGSNRTDIERDGSQYRLWADKLKGAADKVMTFSMQNQRQENPYYLVSNPFPCGLDMNRFFAGNAEVLEPKYWLLTANGQSAAMKDPSSSNWVHVNTGDAMDGPVLASGQGFFVKVRDGKTSCDLKYDAAMMAANADRASLLHAPATRGTTRAESPVLRIRAERKGYASEAVIIKDGNYVDGYAPEEDMETLVDECLAAAPTVYTLAGNRVATFNRRRTLYRVGLGVTGREDETVKLSFSGMGGFDEELSLLDATTGDMTLLSTGADTVSVAVPGRTMHRFFIVSSADGGYMDDGADGTIAITSRQGNVVVTAAGALLLEEVRAIATDGRVFHSATPGTGVYKFHMEPGIYLISVRTVLGSLTRKIVVE